jgi:hypothetical protein
MADDAKEIALLLRRLKMLAEDVERRQAEGLG